MYPFSGARHLYGACHRRNSANSRLEALLYDFRALSPEAYASGIGGLLRAYSVPYGVMMAAEVLHYGVAV